MVRGSDLVGLGTSWSGPIDKMLRNQVSSEAFCLVQFTESLWATPNIQLTINPSQTLDTDMLWVIAVLRLRVAI